LTVETYCLHLEQGDIAWHLGPENAVVQLEMVKNLRILHVRRSPQITQITSKTEVF
jgi:hypothetical protein